MLKVVGMGSLCGPFDVESECLFEKNLPFCFYIEAPIFWWLDFDYEKFGFELGDFSEIEKSSMPVSTMVKGRATLRYQEIVEICEDYINGVYKYDGACSCQWPAEREWADFCETLLDIKGVRDLIQEEN